MDAKRAGTKLSSKLSMLTGEMLYCARSTVRRGERAQSSGMRVLVWHRELSNAMNDDEKRALITLE